jgi:hypothetical protein
MDIDNIIYYVQEYLEKKAAVNANDGDDYLADYRYEREQKAKADLENALNAYIDQRVRVVIEALNAEDK